MTMKRRYLFTCICFSLLTLWTCRYGICQSVTYNTDNQGSITITTAAQELKITFYRDDIVRIYRAMKEAGKPSASLVVTRSNPSVPFETSDQDDHILVSTNKLQIKFDKNDGSLSFFNNEARPIFKELTHKFESFTEYGEDAYSFEQRFSIGQHEGLYGLGQFQDGRLNLRGAERHLVQSNYDAVNPFLVSSEGYGLLWDNYSQSRFKASGDEFMLWSEVGDGIDYYLVATERMDEAISGYRYLTGQSPMLPKWAYGYWQSKERYKNQEEVLSIAKGYRDRNLPLDLVVQDWRYWGDPYHQWSSTEMNAKDFPNPRQMIDELHNQYNTKFMIVAWPMLGNQTEIGLEMIEKGFTYDYDAGERVLYDAYNPEARNIYWKYLNKNLFSLGVDAWWMDGSEPELWEVLNQDHIVTETKKARQISVGSTARYMNPFSLVHTRGVYENQRATTDDKRVCILTRSAFSGQQRYGAVTWSGDIVASYETLKTQISTGLNFSMAGIPYWTQDIGGWLVNAVGGLYKDGNQDLAYKELYTRWFQFGVFNPIFRSHGSNTAREIWQFGGPETKFYKSMARFDRLRYRMMPYIYSNAYQIHANDYTFMRGLVMDFPHDRNVYDIDDQFMFGHALLVSPVTNWMYHPEVATVEAESLYSEDDTAGLVKAEYFKGRNFEEKLTEKNVDKIKFRHAFEPFEGMPIDSFSIRYTGKIKSQAAGVYEFVTSSDDGVRLWINGQLIIDDWTSRAEKLNTSTIQLEANTFYEFKLEYYDDIYAAVLDFGWRKPQPSQVDSSRFQQTTYLPKGTKWYDFWSHELFEGGQKIQGDFPLDLMPIYIKAGSIIPLSPDIQYADQPIADPLEIRIYPGADASFTLYQDEGDNYNYEKGQFSTIQFDWDNQSQTLTIGDRQGSYPGMNEEQKFNIVVVSQQEPLGDTLSTTVNTEVTYSGAKQTLKR